MVLIDGKKTSEILQSEIADEVVRIKELGGRVPHLAAVLVGSDGASETYVSGKVKACERVGFKSTLIRFDENVTESELLNCVTQLNNDADLDGFIVQLPLPKHISENKVVEAINPQKDVDGFHAVNVGRMVVGMSAFISATPFGIMELIKRYKIETSGKNCVVIGRSNIVGRPMSILLSQKGIDCTVTLCHSRTKNLKEICYQADIIVAALGMAEFLTGDIEVGVLVPSRVEAIQKLGP